MLAFSQGVDAMSQQSNCRYISTYDGVSHCSHGAYAQGFCRFHYTAFLAGEISGEGYLSDNLSDQVRRRAINYHGIQPDAVLVGPGSAGT
jgi:hypothetical protein